MLRAEVLAIHSPDAPLAVADVDRIHRLRDVFDVVGFNGSALRKRLGATDAPHVSLPMQEQPRMLRRCPVEEPFGVIARLFVIGVPVVESDAVRSLGAVVEDAVALGVIARSARGELVGLFRVSPLDELLVWAEAGWNPNPPPRSSIVMSISPSTQLLAQFAVPVIGDVLDLGTGCGALAIVAAGRANRVLATDLNPRAVNLATFNARFNRLTNVEIRPGSFFEPVAEELFDRIVTNPPFILSPPEAAGSSPVLYKSAGLRADGVSEMIVRGMAKHLRPGGFGQSLINWACLRGENWRDRIGDWVRESGCDAWLLQFNTYEPELYAAAWMPETVEGGLAGGVREFERWLAYFEREKIESIGYGLITLRKRQSGNGWFAEDKAPEPYGPSGESIVRGFALRDFLLTHVDRELLHVRFRLAPEVRWTQSLDPTDTGWTVSESRLSLTTGLGFGVNVDGLGMRIVTALRGQPLGALLTALAAEMKEDVGRFADANLPLIKCLVEQGIVLPEGV